MQSTINHSFPATVPVRAENGMVASSQAQASQIGLDILKQGGTAIDAAIACNAALGLMEPHMCGLGGDLFAIVWDARSKTLHGLNASGRSAQALSYEALQQRLQRQGIANLPVHGVLPVSVPGAVSGWFALHERFGRLDIHELLQPVIECAQNGFCLTPIIARQWAQAVENLTEHASGDFNKLYGEPGRTPKQGELFRNPALAESYRLLATKGRDAFYGGEIAQRIVNFMLEHSGYIQLNDFTDHHSAWVEPVSVNYRGVDIYELPPNGQGLAALQMLKLLEHDDLSALGHMNADAIHRMLEAKKLVFEDRAQFYADPDCSNIPIEQLLSSEYSVARRDLIKEEAANVVRAGDPLLQHSDTVYLTTADKEGNMVSLIQSIFHPFGSAVVVPDTGFALQNRGMSFSMDPSHANVYAPAKRPFHTIIPAFIMKDGQPFMSFGVMGGDMQPQGHVQIVTNVFDFGMNIQQAGDALRWCHERSTEATDGCEDYLHDGGTVVLEGAFEQKVIDELKRRGHKIKQEDCGDMFGGYQAIMRDAKGVYYGASERRKDGCAIGY